MKAPAILVLTVLGMGLAVGDDKRPADKPAPATPPVLRNDDRVDDSVVVTLPGADVPEKSVKESRLATAPMASFRLEPARVCSRISPISEGMGPAAAVLTYWSMACSRESPASEQRERTSKALGSSTNSCRSRAETFSFNQR